MKHHAWFLAFLLSVGMAGSAARLPGDPDQFTHSHGKPQLNYLRSLSRELSEFSTIARARDFTRLAQYFHRSVLSGAWLPPSERPGATSLIVHSRRLSSNVRSLRHSRSEILADWTQFLGHFLRIKHARFSVVDAQFAGTGPVWVQEAPVEFVLTGTAQDGSLLWVAGRARLDADFVEGRGWRFSRFDIDRLDEYRCPADLLQGSGSRRNSAVR